MVNRDYQAVGYPSQYFVAQMIAKEWVQPVDAAHQLFKASSDITDASGNLLVTAYPIQRPGWELVCHAGEQGSRSRPPCEGGFRECGNHATQFLYWLGRPDYFWASPVSVASGQ
jgi:hypothetical protein